jgi:hypothetical protein
VADIEIKRTMEKKNKNKNKKKKKKKKKKREGERKRERAIESVRGSTGQRGRCRYFGEFRIQN